MIEKRSATSLGRLLLAALVALAAVLPCQAIDRDGDMNAFVGEALTAKFDTRLSETAMPTSKMIFGGVSASAVEGSSERLSDVDDKIRHPLLNNLAERDVYLLIDHTSSMMHEDCPGAVTRWDWLRRQVLSLSEGLEKQIKGNIALVPFAQDFKVYPRVSSPQVKSIMKGLIPAGSTHPEKALQTVFDAYFAQKETNPGIVRPLLVVVVTDGVPNEPDEVIDVVTRATARMTDSREILLTFLQIANDQQGNSIMKELDCDLVEKDGARFDIINRKDFREVQSKGLEACLIEAFDSNIEEKTQMLASAIDE